MFHKIIYLVGEYIKNPLIRKKFDELKQTEYASLETLEALQLKRLKRLLYHARNNTHFYAQRLKDIDIEHITLERLKDIPTLTKQELYKYNKEIHTKYDNEKLVKSETSGSTGEALVFFRTKKWDAYHRAAQLRGYSWYGVNPWDKNIYFWGFNPNWKQKLKMRVLDFLMNRYRIFSFDENEIKKVTKILKKCSYIEGYSSAIFTLAQSLDKMELSFRQLKLVKGTSEKIYDSYQDIIKKVFHTKMVSEYGAAEAGIIAFECTHGNMHTVMENVIVEEIDDKIVVTNLHSYSFPIIRYELGDYIKLGGHDCPCGRKHMIIEEVTGRIGKKIIGYSLSYPTLTLYYIFKNIALNYGIELAYFGVQYIKGKLTIEVLMPTYDIEKLQTYILLEADKYFGNDMDIELKFVYDIERKNKKVKDFESYIED